MSEGKKPRYRQDGWTPERQMEFCDALRRNGSVTDACRAVGKSTTSAYKARERDGAFGMAWDRALGGARPKLEEEAVRRAVEGVEEPVFHQGKQVGVKRKYSDGLLKMLIQRGADPGQDHQPSEVKHVPIEEVEKTLLKQLAVLEKRFKREQHAQALAEEERMRKAGLCP